MYGNATNEHGIFTCVCNGYIIPDARYGSSYGMFIFPDYHNYVSSASSILETGADPVTGGRWAGFFHQNIESISWFEKDTGSMH